MYLERRRRCVLERDEHRRVLQYISIDLLKERSVLWVVIAINRIARTFSCAPCRMDNERGRMVHLQFNVKL